MLRTCNALDCTTLTLGELCINHETTQSLVTEELRKRLKQCPEAADGTTNRAPPTEGQAASSHGIVS
jgi:hypothetical protein